MDELETGLKGFPDCKVCQCYPEGRSDCPDHKECRLVLRLSLEMPVAQNEKV
jgi:hypothetical protein